MKDLKSKVICVLTCVLACLSAQAQTPQFINYQAVARNSETGEELANQTIFLSAKILSNGPNGEIIYQEEHGQTATNAFGLFSLQIGGGNPISGVFSQIDWSTGTHWLEMDMDIGGSLQTIGSMQFVSVPYALYAETTGNVDDSDADPSNELITDLTFDAENQNLLITEAGEVSGVDLSALRDDADADPTNEKISGMEFNTASNVLTVVEGTSSNSVDLTSLLNDADANAANELISTTNGLTLDGDTMLQIVEGGNLHELDLSALGADNDWDFNADNSVVYTTSTKVGIGTSNPQSTFQVNGSVGYGVAMVETLPTDASYIINEDDHIIICKMTGASGAIELIMPNPQNCPGRVITIKRTGPPPLNSYVSLNFNGFAVDYFVQNEVIMGFSNYSARTYISMGDDGWTELMRE